MKQWYLPVGVYLAICIVLFFMQRSMLYFPSSTDNAGAWNVIKSGQEIVGIASSLDKENTLIVFHGNAGNAMMREYYSQIMGESYNLVIAEYPGYGLNSSEEINQENIIRKARLLMKEVKKGQVIVLGESIGSAVAAQMANEFKAHKLILVTPYAKIQNVAQSKFWFLPAYFLIQDKWNTVESIKGYQGTALLIVAENDSIIPPRFAKELYENISGQKYLLEIKNADHNDWLGHVTEKDLSEIKSFLK